MGRLVRIVVLVGGCVAIVLWQRALAPHAFAQGRPYRLLAASGLQELQSHARLARFVYFYHYLSLFPVAIERDRLVYSRQGAERLLATAGDSLVMEWGHAIRGGELGKLFLYLPDVLLKGRPQAPSVRPANSAAFVLALMALFVAFWWIRQPFLGALCVLFLGSNPFQLREVYENENVFGWPITACLFVLALHLPLLARRRGSSAYAWLVPALTGVLMGTVRQIRSEPVPILLSAAVVYLVASGLRWRRRAALLVLLGLSFVATSRAWQAYFDHKFEQARAVVAQAGGHVYPGPRDRYHAFWHAIWCGLGDFDTRHGYAWDDMAAARYARDAVMERYGIDLPEMEPGQRYTWGYWDQGERYYKAHCEMPHYAEVLREKVLHDLTHDPLWYLGTLVRRLGRVLAQTTPVRVAIGPRWVTLPMHGAVFLPLLALLALRRRGLFLKLACFSGGRTPFYSCYHLFAAAILCAWLVELAVAALRRWMRPHDGRPPSPPSSSPDAPGPPSGAERGNEKGRNEGRDNCGPKQVRNYPSRGPVARTR